MNNVGQPETLLLIDRGLLLPANMASHLSEQKGGHSYKKKPFCSLIHEWILHVFPHARPFMTGLLTFREVVQGTHNRSQRFGSLHSLAFDRRDHIFENFEKNLTSPHDSPLIVPSRPVFHAIHVQAPFWFQILPWLYPKRFPHIDKEKRFLA